MVEVNIYLSLVWKAIAINLQFQETVMTWGWFVALGSPTLQDTSHDL